MHQPDPHALKVDRVGMFHTRVVIGERRAKSIAIAVAARADDRRYALQPIQNVNDMHVTAMHDHIYSGQ